MLINPKNNRTRKKSSMNPRLIKMTRKMMTLTMKATTMALTTAEESMRRSEAAMMISVNPLSLYEIQVK